MISDGFKKVNHINGTEKISDDMLHVYTPAGLIQASGYLKYELGKKKCGLVFRGQSDLFQKKLQPTLYRWIKRSQSKRKAQDKLQNIIKKAEKDFGVDFKKYSDVEPQFVNPLLQHYGITTEWLDVVDNIWIALWFACYNAFFIDKIHFIFFRRRDEKCEKIEYFKNIEKKYESKINFLKDIENKENNNSTIIKQKLNLQNEIAELEKEKNRLHRELNEEQYAYILMIRCPGNIGESCGIWRDDTAELYDLRYCLPSIFLRPHAQHGMVIRALTKKNQNTALDFSVLIEGILRINLSDALIWLGNSVLLSPESLFPSPIKDHGLQQLLKSKTLRQYLKIYTP